MTDDPEYDRAIRKLRQLLDQAIAEGDLPHELRPENQETGVVDMARLAELKRQVLAGDLGGIQRHAQQQAVAGLNRGEEIQDPALDAARERVRRRLEEEEEEEEEEDASTGPTESS